MNLWTRKPAKKITAERVEKHFCTKFHSHWSNFLLYLEEINACCSINIIIIIIIIINVVVVIVTANAIVIVIVIKASSMKAFGPLGFFFLWLLLSSNRCHKPQYFCYVSLTLWTSHSNFQLFSISFFNANYILLPFLTTLLQLLL